jgi:hypothetical protein
MFVFIGHPVPEWCGVNCRYELWSVVTDMDGTCSLPLCSAIRLLKYPLTTSLANRLTTGAAMVTLSWCPHVLDESLAHDNGRTSVCAEYGYQEGSLDTNSYRRNPPLQLSIQCSPQRTHKWPNSKPHWATRQQAIAETPAKWSAYQIPSVIVVFVVLVCKVWFVSLIPKSHKRPWTY